MTQSSRVLTRSFLKTLLVIEAPFFGTLSRVILQTSLLFFYRKVKKDSYFKKLDFSAQSVQSLRPGTTKILNVFNYFMF